MSSTVWISGGKGHVDSGVRGESVLSDLSLLLGLTVLSFLCDSYAPRNGDSDWGTRWSQVAPYADFFNRSDWTYVGTAGASGSQPEGPTSSVFPWAGQVILRDAYNGSHWAFFDVGPYGSSGHAHRDKLHLNIRAFGNQLLTDSGRFAYNGKGASEEHCTDGGDLRLEGVLLRSASATPVLYHGRVVMVSCARRAHSHIDTIYQSQPWEHLLH